MNRKEIRRAIRQAIPWVILFGIIAIIFMVGFIVGINAMDKPSEPDKPYSDTPINRNTHGSYCPVQTESVWIEYTATAYCPCSICCGKWALNRPDGIVYTSDGSIAQEGVTIAADWNVLPAGTIIEIDGIGTRTVQDEGSGITENRIDIYFESHQAALNFGIQTVLVRTVTK